MRHAFGTGWFHQKNGEVILAVMINVCYCEKHYLLLADKREVILAIDLPNMQGRAVRLVI